MPLPDLDLLLTATQSRRLFIPLPVARALLGDLLDEATLDQETLVVRPDGDIHLAPHTWIRILLRARDLAAGRTHRPDLPR